MQIKRFHSVRALRLPIQILSLVLLCATAYGEPVINEVLDGAGNTPQMAPGAVFIIKGHDLAVPGLVQAPAPNYPTELNGVSIAFTPQAGGPKIAALMVYTYNVVNVQQLAGVLPSTAAPGKYQVVVTNNSSASQSFQTEVLARKFGIVTANSAGTGPAQATIGGGLTLQRYVNVGTLGGFATRPISPGDRVDFWGSGLGADQASDTGGSSGDQTEAGQIRVFVDGQIVTPLYAGRSQGFPGLDQIVFIMPNNVSLSCFVIVQVRAGGIFSNPVRVATSNGDACTGGNLSRERLELLSRGETLGAGFFKLQTLALEGPPGIPIPAQPSYSESINGGFLRAGIGEGRIENLFMTPGGCIVFRQHGTLDNYFGEALRGNLDGGNPITLLTPTSPMVTLQQLGGGGYGYGFSEDFSAVRQILPGAYRLSGVGGADVGAFAADLSVPAFSWTNRGAIDPIRRNQPLTVTWTGGGNGNVTIWGLSGNSNSGNIDGGVLDSVNFSCTVPASNGSFTLTPEILMQLPASTLNVEDAIMNESPFQLGILGVQLTTPPTSGTFSAPLTSGGSTDVGIFFYDFNIVKLLSIQ